MPAAGFAACPASDDEGFRSGRGHRIAEAIEGAIETGKTAGSLAGDNRGEVNRYDGRRSAEQTASSMSRGEQQRGSVQKM